MKKKTLLVLLAAITLGLSSCGTKANSNGNTPSGNTPSTPEKQTYTITYNLDGGTNDSSNPTTYQEGDTITFAEPKKTGYTFLGWFDNKGNHITGIQPGTAGNLVLTARWTPNKNTLTVTSEDTSKGTVSITSGSGYSDEPITVVATPNLGYKFNGWYNQDNKVSSDATYTFTMPTGDYSLTARFVFDEDSATAHGIIPKISSDGKTITYGLYPQKNVSDSALLVELNKLTTTTINGWYLYNNDYYAKLSAKPRQSGYKFDNGDTIVEGNAYWFKCEPITWNVLSNGNSGYYLLSSVLLDAHCYYHSQDVRIINNYKVYPNDYEDSDIRAWLNNDFYNTAFHLDNDNIQTTYVDNSAETTHSPYNSYWCNDTQDKVFLPSYQDYMNTNYGFINSDDLTDTRKCITTDYARANGVYYYTKINPYYSPYWTRSPFRFTNSTYTSADVDSAGRLAASDVTFEGDAVRPAITLKLT